MTTAKKPFDAAIFTRPEGDRRLGLTIEGGEITFTVERPDFGVLTKTVSGLFGDGWDDGASSLTDGWTPSGDWTPADGMFESADIALRDRISPPKTAKRIRLARNKAEGAMAMAMAAQGEALGEMMARTGKVGGPTIEEARRAAALDVLVKARKRFSRDSTTILELAQVELFIRESLENTAVVGRRLQEGADETGFAGMLMHEGHDEMVLRGAAKVEDAPFTLFVDDSSKDDFNGMVCVYAEANGEVGRADNPERVETKMTAEEVVGRTKERRALAKAADAGFIEFADGMSTALPPDMRPFSLTASGRTAAAWDVLEDLDAPDAEDCGRMLRRIWLDGSDLPTLIQREGEDAYSLTEAGFDAALALAKTPMGESDLKTVGGYTSAAILLTVTRRQAEEAVVTVTDPAMRGGVEKMAVGLRDACERLSDGRSAASVQLDAALSQFQAAG